MQLRQLRRILQEVVLAGLPVSMAGCVDGGSSECVEIAHHTFELETPAADPPLQFQIDRCRVDVDACNALCAMALSRSDLNGWLTACEVELRPGVVSAKVTYGISHDHPGCPVEGRRPHGLTRVPPRHATTAAGAWLAEAAWLEAASVHAFVRLAHELAQHAAPRALIRGSLAAVRDEIRHTAITTRLAARHGATPSAPEVAAPVVRSLEALVVENAVEGCVRETWGAALALWQSHTARDAEVRAAFRTIARDELRHAALAWAIDRWATPRLDRAALARVATARDAAAAALFEAGDAPALPVLGIPEASDLRGLAARAHASLWQGGRSCHA